IARKAGASTQEFGRIAREELGEKLTLALGQISGVRESELPRLTITPNIDLAIARLTENLKKQQDKIKTPVIDFFKELNEDISKTLRDGMVNGISDMMASLGEALATGANVLGSIGKSLLSTLAGLAQ